MEPISGRSSELGIGILKMNPGWFRLCASLITGLNAIKKMIGDMVSPWKTPRVMGKDGLDHSLVETYACR